MFDFTDALRLVAIFIAYGIAGNMDYEDAVLLDEAQQAISSSASTNCQSAITSPPGLAAARVRQQRADRQHNSMSGPASGLATKMVEPCPPAIN